MMSTKYLRLVILLIALATTGCAYVEGVTPPPVDNASLAPRPATYNDLVNLPPPKGRIVASVYSFRDQTGQYRPAPASNFSTAVTQGATAMLSQALSDSNWFITLEREGLQNLLTERKIIRAAQKKPNAPGNNAAELPSLLAANVMFEGGIIAYDTNIKTGGAGARYLGIGGSEQYRVDQVSVNLRAVDIRTGRVLNNVSTSKKILSKELTTGIFKFIEYKELLEYESGYTTNEPTQLAVRAAIEAAVIHIIAQGIKKKSWALNNPSDMDSEVLSRYLNEQPAIQGTES